MLYYSLAVDECTDKTDTAQLAIFIRGVDNSFNVLEELLDVVSMTDRTTGENIFEAVVKTVNKFELPWEKLICVATDGAPSMLGQHSGFTGRLKKFFTEMGMSPENITFLHCIIHREALCAKHATIDNVMSVVIKVVNIIRSHSLHHRSFNKF